MEEAEPVEEEEAEPVEEADTTEEEAEVSDEPIELTITTWTGNEDQLQMFNDIAEAYKVDHPNVSVKFTTIPFGDYVSKVTLQLAGSDPLDAGWIVDNSAPTFIDAGVLADLRPTLESFPDYDYDDLAEGPMSLWTRGDAVYGVPFSTSPYIIFYNKTLFEQAGLETPDVLLEKGEWTWENLRVAAKAIKDETGVYGFEYYGGELFFGPRVWMTMGILMKAFGGEGWNDEGTQCTMNSPEAVAAFEFIHNMIFVDKSAVPPGEIGDFFSGGSGMIIAMLGRTGLLTDADFEWDIAPLPSGPAGYYPTIGQAAFVVFEAGEHVDVTSDFIAFLTTQANVATMSQWFPPARKSVIRSDEFLSSNAMVSPESMALAIQPSIESGNVELVHTNFPKIDLAGQGVIESFWVPGADAQTILDLMCETIQPFMLP
jgi:multiple sugar transport system substrate-binding protein